MYFTWPAIQAIHYIGMSLGSTYKVLMVYA